MNLSSKSFIEGNLSATFEYLRSVRLRYTADVQYSNTYIDAQRAFKVDFVYIP